MTINGTTTGQAANDNGNDLNHKLPEVLLDLAGLLAKAYIATLPLAANDNRASAREA